MSNDPASVIVSTAALLALAVIAGAVGSMRADVRELRSGLDALRSGLDAARAEHGRDVAELREQRRRDRTAVVMVRLAIRRLRRAWGAPLPPEPPEPEPLGFRRPPP